MNTYDISQSQTLYDKARTLIPGGVYGHYGPAAARDGIVKFFSRAQGAHFWDVDGNEYVDLMCAYGPNILGYNHPVVDEAARAQSAQGSAVSIAAPILVELAETLVDTVQGGDWALFGKNGGDGTNLAVRIARAATGRSKIVKVADGYHGVSAWMRPNTPGITAAEGADVLEVPWNDAAAFAALVDEHAGDIACFISSPYDHPVLRDNTQPKEGYWQEMQALCKKHGVVLIVDDVRTGFRIDLAGSHVAYGFQPDLMCFGKAIGNGYPISALVGSDALKDTAKDVFYTGTQFLAAAPMAAAKATIEELKKADAVQEITAYGDKLNAALVDVAASCGHRLVATGVPGMPYYRLDDVPMETHFAWVDECVKRGVYMLGYHNHFVSLAHTEADIERVCDVAAAAFHALKDVAPHQSAAG